MKYEVVEKFSLRMEEILTRNEHKGLSWKDMSPSELHERVLDEFREADKWIKRISNSYYHVQKYVGSSTMRDRYCQELIDVANFCMMICDNLGYLKEKHMLAIDTGNTSDYGLLANSPDTEYFDKKMRKLNKHREFIYFLMAAKSQRLKEIGVTLQYYKHLDRKAIKLWSDKECARVYRELINNIEVLGYSGLYTTTCPFCIRHANAIKGPYYSSEDTEWGNPVPSLNCAICEYGLNHGECDSTTKTNTYDSIFQMLSKTTEDVDALIEQSFATEFYTKVIKDFHRNWMKNEHSKQ